MAGRGAGHLVLSGRSDASAAARLEIEELRRSGCTVTELRADVSRREGTDALISAAGIDRLRGIIHCAGVTADAALIHQDWAHLRCVMEAKVAGAWNLHCATESLALDHFVLFSTAAAFLGSAGQANHAAANAFLSGLARHRRARGLTALAIDWGAWSEVGAATQGDILERAHAAGLGSLNPETGLAILERLMLADETHVAAVAVDWEAFLGRKAGAASRGLFEQVRSSAAQSQGANAEGPESPRTGGLARAVMAALPRSRRPVLLDGLHADAARVLGLASGEVIDADTPLTALGLDSLMAVELRNSIALDMDRTLPATLLFNYPTLAELTDFLAGELGILAPIDRLRGAGDSDDALDALTEEEMAGFLERKLKTSGPVR
jgi:acyl carrier protein